MKALIVFSTVFSFITAFGHEPICTSPQAFAKSEIRTIFSSEDLNLTNNQLIIYSVNPPTPINWSSPGKLFKSIVKNSFIKEGYEVNDVDYEGTPIKRKQNIKTHFIGHMFMELKCAGYPTILTGMSSPGYEEIKGLMIEGKSFNQIITSTKGHFNTAEELQEEIELRKTKVGNLSSLGINLQHNSCEELLKYLTEYRACGVQTRYGGLDANPHKGEGAGCSAFALSFLQRLNIMPMIEDLNDGNFGHEFMRKIIVPHKMLKIKDRDPEVGAWGLLRGVDISWATSNNAGREIKFFDPELFSKWVADYQPESEIPGLQYLGREKNNLVKSVWFNETSTSIDQSSFNLDYLK